MVILATRNCQSLYKSKGDKHSAKFMPRYDGLWKIIQAFPEKSKYIFQTLTTSFHTS